MNIPTEVYRVVRDLNDIFNTRRQNPDIAPHHVTMLPNREQLFRNSDGYYTDYLGMSREDVYEILGVKHLSSGVNLNAVRCGDFVIKWESQRGDSYHKGSNPFRWMSRDAELRAKFEIAHKFLAETQVVGGMIVQEYIHPMADTAHSRIDYSTRLRFVKKIIEFGMFCEVSDLHVGNWGFRPCDWQRGDYSNPVVFDVSDDRTIRQTIESNIEYTPNVVKILNNCFLNLQTEEILDIGDTEMLILEVMSEHFPDLEELHYSM